MNGRSPNFNNQRFTGGTPIRNNQNFGGRQPLYLQPNSPHMSPRGRRMSSPRTSSGSPDFIPLGISSPVGRARDSWGQRNYSNASSYSNQSTPPSSNSSNNFSPYRRQGSWGKFRGKNSFNNSGSGTSSPHISLYIDKECLEDPWAQLEGKMKHLQTPVKPKEKESDTNSLVQLDSESEESGSNDS